MCLLQLLLVSTVSTRTVSVQYICTCTCGHNLCIRMHACIFFYIYMIKNFSVYIQYVCECTMYDCGNVRCVVFIQAAMFCLMYTYVHFPELF